MSLWDFRKCFKHLFLLSNVSSCMNVQVCLLLYNKLQNPVFNYRIEYIIEIKTWRVSISCQNLLEWTGCSVIKITIYLDLQDCNLPITLSLFISLVVWYSTQVPNYVFTIIYIAYILICVYGYTGISQKIRKRETDKERERKYRSDTFSSEILPYGLHNSYTNKEPPPLTTKSG